MGIMSSTAARVRNITAMAALVACLGGAVVAAAPAQAATYQSSCSVWTNGRVWQTSQKWGRVRERVCVQYSNASRAMRPVVQTQVDWPANCTLSVGLPPSGEVGCPVSVVLKERALEFKALYLRLAYEPGDGRAYTLTCKAADRFAGSVMGPQVTYSCYPKRWHAIRSGGKVSTTTTADVKDDGDGLKGLGTITDTFTYENGYYRADL